MESDIDYRKLVEAALFMSSNALGVEELARLTGIASPGRVSEILQQLRNEYAGRDTAIELIEINRKYMFSLKEPYGSRVGGLAKESDLSRGALRILAYVSKNDGILQSQLVQTFGESTYEYVKELREKEFVETEKQKRSKKVVTTPKFREYFNA